MKSIRIWFTDLNPNLDIKNSISYKYLQSRYSLTLDPENPDYVVSGVFGTEHMRYENSVKILISEENVSPDFNLFDYAITSDYLQMSDRHLRVPYWALRHLADNDVKPTSRNAVPSDKDALERKFCNFVYSNSSNYCAMPMRNELFDICSTYRHIDAGGTCRNNMGGKKVVDKMEFISKYKFTIACENSIKPGYSTEKIIDPLIANSIPIYLGDPMITNEFNPKAFVNVADFQNQEELLQRLRILDTDQDLYLEMLHSPIFTDNTDWLQHHILNARDFLDSIFQRPFTEAMRRCRYGWTYITVERYKGLCKPLDTRIIDSLRLRFPLLARLFRKHG